jgi:hypothetical protein
LAANDPFKKLIEAQIKNAQNRTLEIETQQYTFDAASESTLEKLNNPEAYSRLLTTRLHYKLIFLYVRLTNQNNWVNCQTLKTVGRVEFVKYAH